MTRTVAHPVPVSGGEGPAHAVTDLASFFRPRSLALVGATERSIWSNAAYANVQKFGFKGAVHLINPKGGIIYDRPAATSCVAVGEAIDAALLMVPEAAMQDALADLAAAGVKGAVVLTAGFAEAGPEGVARQDRLRAAAQRAGVRLLGPNCLGFVNYADGAPLWTTRLHPPVEAPTIAVASQSGATAMQIANFATQQRIGLSHMISTGNEADIDIADALMFLANEPSVGTIALFLETVRRPDAFLAGLRAADAAGKPVVVLKVGSSAVAARAAQAHTGSLVGDDRVFDALCRQMGVPRVHSIEDLVCTADLLARAGTVRGRGLALVGMSGGMCEIASDKAERVGIELPELAPATLASLRAVLPDFATPGNPLDVTGGAMLQPSMLTEGVRTIAADPGIGMVACLFDAPATLDAGDARQNFVKHVADGFAGTDKPCLLLSHSLAPVTADARRFTRDLGVAYSGAGIDHGMTALGHLFDRARQAARQQPSRPLPTPSTLRPVGERPVLDYLAGCGVPVIPACMTRTAEEAVTAAAGMDGPVVLKIASPDIAHKTEIGGVALNLKGADAVRRAWQSMWDGVRRAAHAAQLDGIVCSPMRGPAVELFVGSLRDPQWGPLLAVGLGGVFVEVLQDTALRLLPITQEDALSMLEELRGRAMLDGFRGLPPVDRMAVARALVAIGDAALALGTDLVSLEINPLRVEGAMVEALDGLAVWQTDAQKEAAE